jgi:hypothetical protein
VRKGATTGGWNDHFYKETAADSDFEPGFGPRTLSTVGDEQSLRTTETVWSFSGGLLVG